MDQLCAEALRDYQRAFFGLDVNDMPRYGIPLRPELIAPRSLFDPSSLFPILDQPKPQHSYIGLIAMAILSSPDKKMVLSEVYEWIMMHYPYFRTRGSGWRNSIRHNLSLNDCFVKAGRAANGKGHYWAVHPACLRDFERGDFRRRRAQRKTQRGRAANCSLKALQTLNFRRPTHPTKETENCDQELDQYVYGHLQVRRHMGLSVPDGESSDDSPSPSPAIPFPIQHMKLHMSPSRKRDFSIDSLLSDDL